MGLKANLSCWSCLHLHIICIIIHTRIFALSQVIIFIACREGKIETYCKKLGLSHTHLFTLKAYVSDSGFFLYPCHPFRFPPFALFLLTTCQLIGTTILLAQFMGQFPAAVLINSLCYHYTLLLYLLHMYTF